MLKPISISHLIFVSIGLDQPKKVLTLSDHLEVRWYAFFDNKFRVKRIFLDGNPLILYMIKIWINDYSCEEDSVLRNSVMGIIVTVKAFGEKWLDFGRELIWETWKIWKLKLMIGGQDEKAKRGRKENEGYFWSRWIKVHSVFGSNTIGLISRLYDYLNIW